MRNSNIPIRFRVGTPLDMHTANYYQGEIVYDAISKRCYVYKDNGFIEITNSVTPSKNKEALVCKCCGAVLKTTQCEYCGVFSWEARDFFL